MVEPMVLFCLFVFVILILLEIPIPFSMIASSSIYAIYNNQSALMFAQRTAASFSDYSLLAIPTFIFVGCYMNAIGLSDRIFNFCVKLLGRIPGGLAHANILGSMVFAGMSGSALADAGGLGVIEVKAMKYAGYDEEFAVATTAASSTIGPIIPPSINLVVYGFMAQVPTISLFIGGFLPGVLMGITMMVWIAFGISKNKIKAPKASPYPLKVKLASFIDAIPALIAPLLLTGGILSGAFTATECGCIACLYLLIVAIFYKRLKWNIIVDSLKQTITTTAMVVFLIATGSIFNWMIITGGFITYLTDALLALNSTWLILMVFNIILLIMGCFMGGMPILIMMIPLIVNLANSLGLNLVHLGVVVVLNLTLGLITPPMAPSLFTTCRVTGVSFEGALKQVWQFLIPLFVTLFLTTYIPDLVLWLPRVFGV